MTVTGVPTHSHHVGAPGPTVGSWSVTLHWRLFLLTLLYMSTSSRIRTITSQHYRLYTHAAVYWAASHLTAHPCHLTPYKRTPAYTRAVLLVSPEQHSLSYVRRTLVYAAQATVKGSHDPSVCYCRHKPFADTLPSR
jgi:hypothetical protein